MDRWLKSGSLRKQSVSPSPAQQISVENVTDDKPNESSVDALQQVPAFTDSTSLQIAAVQTASGSGVIKKRMYHDSYLDLGFVETDEGKAQCVICARVLPNSSMVPVKLRRHFEGTHPELREKQTDYFKRKHTELAASQTLIKTHAKTVNENSLKASYLVSYRVAQAGKAHSIAETLIKPCVSDIVSCMLDDKAVKLVTSVPLSNNTVKRRILDLSSDVKESLVSRIKHVSFSLQIDESTDVAGLAILLAFVRYEYSGCFEEDLLLCKPLPANTTGAEIFRLLDDFFTMNEIPWSNCIDVCTDGAKAMTGSTVGVITRIKEKSKNCSSSHCVLHRHALAMKQMPASFKKVLDESVQIINYIKARPLKSRLFVLLCDDMGSLHNSLLLHTEVRWLSRGKALSRLQELRSEVLSLLMDHNIKLANVFNDERWQCILSYLSDIFMKMNEMSLSLQGMNITTFEANDKVRAFKRKIQFWVESVQKKEVECFPVLNDFLHENKLDLEKITLTDEICEHLRSLEKSLEHYFPTARDTMLQEHEWVVKPFSVSKKPTSLSSSEYECLIDITSDSTLKSTFECDTYSHFWLRLENKKFQPLVEKAKRVLLPFATTYLCESGFSIYAATKTKYRCRLDAEPDIRLRLSKIKPDISKLCQLKQPHSSH